MPADEDYHFSLEFEVRDYECDLQGIVNNAVYQNYLEHTRHRFLKTIGIDFAEFTRRNIHLVVTRAELDYKHPLKSGERFRVSLNLERHSRLRFVFVQNIHRQPDNKLIVKARFIATALNERGKPFLPPVLERALNGV